MSFAIEKNYNDDYTFIIEPDDDYKYILIESKRSGAFFIQIDRNNMGKIITTQGIDIKSYDMKNFWTYPDNKVTIINKKFSLTLPSISKYRAESN